MYYCSAGNGLAVIHPSAFDSLWSLKELDLSDNQLTALNHQWFSKLEALQKLNLLNNPHRCRDQTTNTNVANAECWWFSVKLLLSPPGAWALLQCFRGF